MLSVAGDVELLLYIF